MTHYALRCADDVVTRYRVHAGDAAVGEIRHEQIHADSLHLGTRRYWLVNEDAERGTSHLARFIGRLRPDRTYVLRDGETELARARRHWSLFGRRDWIEFRTPGDTAAIEVTARGLLAGDIRLHRAGAELGTMAITGTWREGVTLQAPGLTVPQATLLMLAVHRAWGNVPRTHPEFS